MSRTEKLLQKGTETLFTNYRGFYLFSFYTFINIVANETIQGIEEFRDQNSLAKQWEDMEKEIDDFKQRQQELSGILLFYN